MLAAPVTFSPMAFSSLQIPQAARFAEWSRLLNKWLLNAEMKAAADHPFEVSVQLCVLPNVRVGWGNIDASFNNRSRSIAANDTNDLMLFINLGGKFVASQHGRDFELRPGDAYLMACCEPGTYDRPTKGSVMCVRVGHDALSPLVRNVFDKTGRVISGETESLRLLSGYVRMLTPSEPLATPAGRDLATRHLHELLAVSLGATGDAEEAARSGGLEAARLKTIQSYVERHATDPQLSPDGVAAQFRISPRTLQRLFERYGTTFSDYVLNTRLNRAHGRLGDPRVRTRSIADIAFECGFGDVSYFNRRFRARYGASPTDVRHHRLFSG